MKPPIDFSLEAAGRDDDERVLPLINIIFLLLIFFMLAGQLASSDPLDVTPPASASETPSEMVETVVYVSGDGQLGLDNAVVGEAELKPRSRRQSGRNRCRSRHPMSSMQAWSWPFPSSSPCAKAYSGGAGTALPWSLTPAGEAEGEVACKKVVSRAQLHSSYFHTRRC